jgi:hypothetical protein
MPRPKLNRTTKQRAIVKSMAACGIPHEQIAKQIGIRSPKTLRKYFRNELDSGVTEANYQVATSMYHKARNGDVEAGKFWLKCRAGWREYPNFGAATGSLPPFVVAKDDGVQQP